MLYKRIFPEISSTALQLSEEVMCEREPHAMNIL